MVLILGVVFVLLYLVRTKLAILIVLSVFLVFANTLVFGAITYFGFKSEEIKDAKELASLYNQIKVERIAQLNYMRM